MTNEEKEALIEIIEIKNERLREDIEDLNEEISSALDDDLDIYDLRECYLQDLYDNEEMIKQLKKELENE